MGGFLTVGYSFPYCFLEIFVGGQGLDRGGKFVIGGSPSPPTRENFASRPRSKQKNTGIGKNFPSFPRPK